ncbi:hypothetical protein F2Q69_00012210 [Brassica cretica]|uniref:Uncharacterized protein n=1 Tax=Brassica cretica TaxID=69181 RepID=A0A8S9R3X2_BRACR|nr:hypothetical protein F2Q69_00012210 [Brassica cretica]
MRGFNQPRKQKTVRHWVQAARLSFGCLLETKVSVENFQKVFDASFPGWSCLHNYSHHSLGRIWVCWSDEVEVCPVLTSAHMITVWVKYKVVGTNNAWIMHGDSNVALSVQEHSRALATRSDHGAIRDFQEVVHNCDMMDLAQVGSSFTWTNCQDDNPISKKLDRLREVAQGNMKPFKFFNHVALHPRFLEVVARVWNEIEPLFHSRAALRKFHENLKSLKFEMRSLNKDMYGDLPGRVKAAYEDLCAKQTEAMQNPHTASFEVASDAWEHWHHISGVEQFYYQKSRIQWLGLGDRNSRFFHRVTQNAKNTIRKIVTTDGRILTSLPDIKQEAATHFETFLNGSQPDYVR